MNTAKNSHARLKQIYDTLVATEQNAAVQKEIDELSLKMMQPDVYGAINETGVAASLLWFDLTTEFVVQGET